MNESTILSIVIPVFNTGLYLDETIKSIKEVNFSYAYEIILVNDGSTDVKTLEILEKYNKEFKVIHQKNGGPSGARNLGIEMAVGKYILPFDSDDIMYKNNYNLALQKMIENDSIDILYGDYKIFGKEKRYVKSGNYNRLCLIYSANFIPSLSVFKKEVWEELGGYDESMNYAEDWDFWSRCAVSNKNFYYMNKPMYQYRKMSDGKSLSQSKYKIRQDNILKLKSKIPVSVFNKESISDYVVQSVRENRKLKIKLLLRIFFPRLFSYFQKKKLFPNGVVVE